jgi:AcrR family transcriptional regulator
MARAATVESAKKEAILAAALELFAERGFHGTAVPLVAERARVGAGTLYRYFDSKEALVNAVFQKWKGVLASILVQNFPTRAPVREQFHEIWDRLALFASEQPLAFAFLELHHHQPYLDETSRAIENTILESILAILREAQRLEVLKPVPAELLVAVAYGAFVGIVKGAQAHGVTLTPEHLAVGEQCVWEAIRR